MCVVLYSTYIKQIYEYSTKYISKCVNVRYSSQDRFLIISFAFTVKLVERNAAPAGYQLLNTRQVGLHQASDIVELAREIQTADKAIRNTATGKLTLILEQVRKRSNIIDYIPFFL